jgi:uncharacterized protein YkwD
MADLRALRRLSVRSVIVAFLATACVAIPSTNASASTPSAATAAYDAQQVLLLINSERRANGLSALTWSTRLVSAAHGHNLRMAKANVLSHQLPGEPSLGSRITAAGYKWRAIGENAGYTTDWTLTGILKVAKGMYAEVAPNDGHRRNILSKSFRNVGIDIVMDAVHHKAWITEDFGALL